MLPFAYHHPHDGHTVTHYYGRHAIFIDHSIRPGYDDEHEPVTVSDRRLTVSDLLDYYDTDDFSASDLIARSSDDDRESANRIHAALGQYRRLSPEDRAEFDRRTT